MSLHLPEEESDFDTVFSHRTQHRKILWVSDDQAARQLLERTNDTRTLQGRPGIYPNALQLGVKFN